MKRSIVISLILIQAGILCFCHQSPEGDTETAYLEGVIKRKKRQRDIDSFTIPDSINSTLIIAAYFEDSPKGNIIILYADSNKIAARKLKYFSAGTTSSDALQKINFNTFRSVHNGSEYVIKEQSVAYYYPASANVTAVEEFQRTDRDY